MPIPSPVNVDDVDDVVASRHRRLDLNISETKSMITLRRTELPHFNQLLALIELTAVRSLHGLMTLTTRHLRTMEVTRSPFATPLDRGLEPADQVTNR